MNQIAPRETSINSVSVSTGANGTSIAPQNLGEVVRFAEVMCKADIALPKHLRGNAGACMAVAMQALEWQMSPFAVASKSYEVGGRIAYEAQLIAAVVNTRSGIKGRLKYQFDGGGPTMTCTVTGILDDEECVYTSPAVGNITVKNSPLWKSEPQQQLGYFSARSWARRHCPEVLLGVYDRDEVESFQGADNAKDVTPRPSIMERLAANKPQGEQEGFDAANVTRETDSLAGDATNQNTDALKLAPSGDAGSSAASITDNAASTNTAKADQSGDTSETSAEVSPDSTDHDFDETEWLQSFAKRVSAAIGSNIDQLETVISAELVGGLSEDAETRAGAIVRLAKTACGDADNKANYVKMIAGKARLEEKELANG
ncbi:hypothetical protein FHS21_001286 [Phyllobacterium trifolii]|uniref:Recombinase RecT n=1 Tax=Phyllobacterium trifolii TaxID=300193 RepID=A0A839U4D5_9HYPH|nr:recombinase RecT [Phyllobacterium trifolii]MBB3144885.1 hypothetical protein [Phyllobacterium trifolii]